MSQFDEEIVCGLYYHLLWSTKDQKACISSSCAQQLYTFICDLALSLECYIIEGQVFADHVELVVKASVDVSLVELITTLKSGSMLWLKNSSPCFVAFEWQRSEFVFTVSTEEVGFITNTAKSFIDKIPQILNQNGCIFSEKEILE